MEGTEISSDNMWDIKDPVLPQVTKFDEFKLWPDGHCQFVYNKSKLGSDNHKSGWAMRNTNNHDRSILKKSCVGVLVCSKNCVYADNKPRYLRPGICDKARSMHIGTLCPNSDCDGNLIQRPCRGHGNFPVTHFWRTEGDRVYFQSKGVHDHPRPMLKPFRRKRETKPASNFAKTKKYTTPQNMLLDCGTFDNLSSQYMMNPPHFYPTMDPMCSQGMSVKPCECRQCNGLNRVGSRGASTPWTGSSLPTGGATFHDYAGSQLMPASQLQNTWTGPAGNHFNTQPVYEFPKPTSPMNSLFSPIKANSAQTLLPHGSSSPTVNGNNHWSQFNYANPILASSTALPLKREKLPTVTTESSFSSNSSNTSALQHSHGQLPNAANVSGSDSISFGSPPAVPGGGHFQHPTHFMTERGFSHFPPTHWLSPAKALTDFYSALPKSLLYEDYHASAPPQKVLKTEAVASSQGMGGGYHNSMPSAPSGPVPVHTSSSGYPFDMNVCEHNFLTTSTAPMNGIVKPTSSPNDYFFQDPTTLPMRSMREPTVPGHDFHANATAAVPPRASIYNFNSNMLNSLGYAYDSASPWATV